MPTDDQALNQVASLYSLRGKKGLVLGIANQQSIAWGCAQLARQLGADVVATCLNDKARKYVEPLTEPLGIDLINCNVEDEGALSALVNHAAERLGHIDFVIHSIAWAPLEDLHGRVIDSSSVGFARAMEVSCHSFATLAKLAAPHMKAGGSMITMTYLGADEAVPHYGLMGSVKAALYRWYVMWHWSWGRKRFACTQFHLAQSPPARHRVLNPLMPSCSMRSPRHRYRGS